MLSFCFQTSFVLCFGFVFFYFFEVRKEFSASWIWGLIGFRFLGLRLIVDFVSFTVLYMFQIYRDLDVAF